MDEQAREYQEKSEWIRNGRNDRRSFKPRGFDVITQLVYNDDINEYCLAEIIHNIHKYTAYTHRDVFALCSECLICAHTMLTLSRSLARLFLLLWSLCACLCYCCRCCCRSRCFSLSILYSLKSFFIAVHYIAFFPSLFCHLLASLFIISQVKFLTANSLEV